MKLKNILFLFILVLVASCSSSDDSSDEPQNNCETPFGLATNIVEITRAELTWTAIADVSSYQVEYGESGFSTGSGTTVNVSTNSAEINNLLAATSYDFYVRSNCSAQSISDYSSSLTAMTDACPVPTGFSPTYIGETTADFGWIYIPHDFIVEYGPTGFTLGTGTTVDILDNNFIALNNLMPDTTYDIYLRAKCGDSLGDHADVLQFSTFPICRVPENLRLEGVSSTWITITWDDIFGTFWEIEYGAPGFPLGTGTVLQSNTDGYFVQGLTPNTTYEFYVRSNCGSDGYSEYADPLTATTDP